MYKNVEEVRTLEEFEREFVDPWFRGAYRCLIVVGRPGLSKSYAFEKRLDNNTIHLKGGRLSALEAYKKLGRLAMENQGICRQNVVMDDAETVYEELNGKRFIRQITESPSKRSPSWETATPKLDGIPQSYYLTGNVAIICNKFVFGASHEFEAILDRSEFVYVNFTNLEIHKIASQFFWDNEIFKWIGKRIHLMDDLSVRAYMRAANRKAAGTDWRKMLMQRHMVDDAKSMVRVLTNDKRFKTEAERVEEFFALTGQGRSTYYDVKKKLKEEGQLEISLESAARIKLQHPGKKPKGL